MLAAEALLRHKVIEIIQQEVPAPPAPVPRRAVVVPAVGVVSIIGYCGIVPRLGRLLMVTHDHTLLLCRARSVR